MSAKKITVVSDSAPATGKVDNGLLSHYGESVQYVSLIRGEADAQIVALEIAFMREAVAKKLSTRDLQATIRAGVETAEAEAKAQAVAGVKVTIKPLPHLGVGKVRSWKMALEIIDTVVGSSALELSEILNLAWNTQRLPEEFEVSGKSLEEVESAIPPREVKGNPDKPAVSRKSTTRAVPTLSELAQLVEQVVEGLPADLDSLSEFDLVAIAKIAKHFASLSRKVSKVAA